MEDPFTALISDIGQTLAGLRQNAFSSVQNPFGGNMWFGGGQNPFGGDSPFQAQQPFQGNTWRIGGMGGGGFQVSNPFGQNPFNVQNFQQMASPQTSGTSSAASGQANTQLMGNANPQTVDQWIAQTRPNSPLKGQGAFIVQTAQQYGVPVPMVLGIMMQESQLGADGSALPQQNNFTGLTGTGWQGQTGTTQGMARAFATFATPQDGIRAAIENFAKNYQGLTVRQAVSKWLTGDPNGSGDEQGNSVNDYLRTMQTVFQAFGVQWNPDAVPTLGTANGAVPTQGSGDLDQLANGGAQWAAKARTVMGVPYTNAGIRDTGDPRSGMDCSSFVGWAKGIDRNLWNAQAQYDASQKIDAAQLQPGDLVFFQGTTSDDSSARPVTHVGIYIGGGKMVHTGGSPGVQVVDLNTDYWRQHWYGYGRLG